MFSKNPAKESLRQMLQAKCDDAMLLDRSVHKLYAAEELPSKTRYRPRKKPAVDAYLLEIQQLSNAQTKTTEADTPLSEANAAKPEEFDFQALEIEAAAFARNRGRK